uniref:NADH-ubiquinone oxidoreductase chain 6 n=1 Tax=Callispa bowringii TaxID=2558238 RepID=A0A482JND0_9CUCU|nr:NADH dehydrogenase subunit 6 [Callispa bowringii]QBP33867.1 NADH dehydrogenase subunit 6 [Callispa bowringii]
MKFFMMISLWTSLMFLLSSHPVTMSILILIQALITSLITGFFFMNFWFSYIIFLVMIGGLLVLFMYMTNVASNEKFSMSKKMIFISMMMIIMYISMLITDNYFIMSQLNFTLNSNMYLMTISKFFNYPMNFIMIMMMIYLLITMIMSVKITDLTKGPLRQKH